MPEQSDTRPDALSGVQADLPSGVKAEAAGQYERYEVEIPLARGRPARVQTPSRCPVCGASDGLRPLALSLGWVPRRVVDLHCCAGCTWLVRPRFPLGLLWGIGFAWPALFPLCLPEFGGDAGSISRLLGENLMFLTWILILGAPLLFLGVVAALLGRKREQLRAGRLFEASIGLDGESILLVSGSRDWAGEVAALHLHLAPGSIRQEPKPATCIPSPTDTQPRESGGEEAPSEGSGLTERHCPYCRKPASAAQVCPHCRRRLVHEPRPGWQASLLGYLYGGLMGAVALILVKLAELVFHFTSRTLEMVVFGVVAYGTWTSMREHLTQHRDKGIFLPRTKE